MCAVPALMKGPWVPRGRKPGSPHCQAEPETHSSSQGRKKPRPSPSRHAGRGTGTLPVAPVPGRPQRASEARGLPWVTQQGEAGRERTPGLGPPVPSPPPSPTLPPQVPRVQGPYSGWSARGRQPRSWAPRSLRGEAGSPGSPCSLREQGCFPAASAAPARSPEPCSGRWEAQVQTCCLFSGPCLPTTPACPASRRHLPQARALPPLSACRLCAWASRASALQPSALSPAPGPPWLSRRDPHGVPLTQPLLRVRLCVDLGWRPG